MLWHPLPAATVSSQSGVGLCCVVLGGGEWGVEEHPPTSAMGSRPRLTRHLAHVVHQGLVVLVHCAAHQLHRLALGFERLPWVG